MKYLKLKIKEFLDQRQNVLWEEHEREYAAQKLFEMFDKELQRQTPKKSLLIKIEHYKKVLKMAKVPNFIIEHPSFVRSMPLTKEDIDWAKKAIAEHRDYVKFRKKHDD